MKHLLLIAFVLVSTCLAVGQKRDTVKELISMENRFNDALLRADWNALDAIEADDLIFTKPTLTGR